jgi:hypothetical protein
LDTPTPVENFENCEIKKNIKKTKGILYNFNTIVKNIYMLQIVFECLLLCLNSKKIIQETREMREMREMRERYARYEKYARYKRDKRSER